MTYSGIFRGFDGDAPAWPDGWRQARECLTACVEVQAIPPGDRPAIVPGETPLEGIMHQQTIADLAYALWQARGCPEGSADIDWIEAERQVMNSRRAPEGVENAAQPPVAAP
jgi:hypothetical protein